MVDIGGLCIATFDYQRVNHPQWVLTITHRWVVLVHYRAGRFATSQATLWKFMENPWKAAFSTAKSVCR